MCSGGLPNSSNGQRLRSQPTMLITFTVQCPLHGRSGALHLDHVNFVVVAVADEQSVFGVCGDGVGSDLFPLWCVHSELKQLGSLQIQNLVLLCYKWFSHSIRSKKVQLKIAIFYSASTFSLDEYFLFSFMSDYSSSGTTPT